jgi:hypothetical protein
VLSKNPFVSPFKIQVDHIIFLKSRELANLLFAIEGSTAGFFIIKFIFNARIIIHNPAAFSLKLEDGIGYWAE